VSSPALRLADEGGELFCGLSSRHLFTRHAGVGLADREGLREKGSHLMSAPQHFASGVRGADRDRVEQFPFDER